jgi:sugar lactone lactonase YvrE
MKKQIIKRSLVLGAVVCLFAINACQKDNPDPVPILTFSTPNALSCLIGSTSVCSNVATSTIASGGAISYSINSTSIASVNAATGAITPISAGTAIVTASQAAQHGKNEAASSTYTLTITAPDPTPVLTFATGPYNCFVGASTPCTWTATSTVPTGGVISYSITPTTVATINASTGTITAISAGTATVTATQAASVGKNSPASATYTLTVIGLSITSFTPTFGGVGYSVTITGANFDGVTAANNHVTINGIATATPVNISTTSLTVLVPKGATGAGNIEVKVGAQTATKGTFTEYATVTTLAGDGTQGYKDDTGMKAQFFTPGGLALDNAGNILVADYGNALVRSITMDGVVTTVAGTASEFSEPWGITVNKTSGLVYVSDRSTNLIKKVNLSTGSVSTFAGSTYAGDGHNNGTNLTNVQFDQPHGLAFDDFGNMYVTDRWFSLVREIVSGGYVITLAGNATSSYVNGNGANTGFYFPDGIVVEPNGNFLLAADYTNNCIRKITIQGTIAVSTFAGASPADNGNGGTIDGTGTAARFGGPSGLAMDAAGNAYVADYNNGLIRKITPAGIVTTLAGQPPTDGAYLDGLGPFAKIYQPWGITVAADGSAIYVSDGTNRIRKIVP